jgi:integrase
MASPSVLTICSGEGNPPWSDALQQTAELLSSSIRQIYGGIYWIRERVSVARLPHTAAITPRGRRVIAVRAGYAKIGEARSVPMNQLLTDILKSVKLANYQGDKDSCDRDGTPYRSCRPAFVRAVRKAEIADFTCHDLRRKRLKTSTPP